MKMKNAIDGTKKNQLALAFHTIEESAARLALFLSLTESKKTLKK
jgi:hypothetical protein